MKQYLDVMKHILDTGIESEDRTGVGTIRSFSQFMKYDLSEGFPIVTTKQLQFGIYAAELLWFLEGSTDERRLVELTYMKPRDQLVGKKTIWTANADNQGKALGHQNDDYIKELGNVYGKQMRDQNGHDQIKSIIDEIKTNPNSRRMVLNNWNVVDLPNMALPPCHTMVIFNVINGKLNCHLTQR